MVSFVADRKSYVTGGNLPASRQLLSACERGDHLQITRILDDGFSVDAPLDESGNTALAVTCANAPISCVRLLLSRGAALEAANAYGWTPLMQAARHGRQDLVALLLNNKANPRATSASGVTPLLCAVCGADVGTVKTLLKSGVDVGTRSSRGPSPLALASAFGYVDVVRLLLEVGVDADRSHDATRLSPLTLAAMNGRLDAVVALVDHGANPNTQDVLGNTALDYAAARTDPATADFLRDRTSLVRAPGRDPRVKADIVEASRHGDVVRIRELLRENPVHANARSPQDGATPLMFAAMIGRRDIVEILVAAGARLDVQDKVTGWTALMQATFKGHKDIVKFLIGAGASVDVRAKNGDTAYTLASTIDAADTEMLRLVASSSAAASKGEKRTVVRNPSAIAWAAPARIVAKAKDGDRIKEEEVGETSMRSEEALKNGSLKLWWNRMSNRFRNLKLGRTFRLAPMPVDAGKNEEASSSQAVLNDGSCTPVNEDLTDKECYSDLWRPHTATASSLSPPTPDLRGDVSVRSSSSGYISLDLSAKRVPSLHSTGGSSVNSAVKFPQDDLLKPVVPPFHLPPGLEPPPDAELDVDVPLGSFTDAPCFGRSAGVGARACSGTATSPMPPGRTSRPSAKLFAPHRGTHRHPSPSSSGILRSGGGTPSPHSSGGASSVSAVLRLPLTPKAGGGQNGSLLMSSGDSSTLTAGSDPKTGSNTLGSSPGVRCGVVGSLAREQTSSPALSFLTGLRSSVPSSSSRLHPSTSSSHRQSAPSHDSHDSGTLTPTPSLRNASRDLRGAAVAASESLEDEEVTPGEEDDHLAGLLSRLSLERYQRVFEEQEVDVEAFLTLDDEDLEELGIAADARGQILTAIKRLNESR